jgi:hypothetical protein
VQFLSKQPRTDFSFPDKVAAGRIPDAPAPKRESAPSPGPAKPVMVPIPPLE